MSEPLLKHRAHYICDAVACVGRRSDIRGRHSAPPAQRPGRGRLRLPHAPLPGGCYRRCHADMWDLKCGLVEAYVRENGKLPTQKYKTPSGIAIGPWMNRQLTGRDKLSDNRKARLEAIPGWVWHTMIKQVPLSKDKNEAWHLTCCLVETYVRENGKLPIQKYKTPDGIAIGAWVITRRHGRDKLSDERKARLETIPGWVWQARTKWIRLSKDNNEAWNLTCDLVEAYARENGKLPSLHYETPNGVAIGPWINRQRTIRDKLLDDRKARLEAIPCWVWQARAKPVTLSKDKNEAWNLTCELGEVYVREHNMLPSRSYKTSNGISIGNWIYGQRRNRDKLSDERKARLEAIPGWYW